MQEQTIDGSVRQALARHSSPALCTGGAAGTLTRRFQDRRPGSLLVYAPGSQSSCAAPWQLCRENGVRVYLLGNGSNTLFDDAGL